MLDRVAFSGKIDLTKGDPRDRRWWTRLAIAMKQASHEQEVAFCQLRFQYQLFSAMLCEPGSPGRSESYEAAGKEYEKINKILRPWLFVEKPEQDPKDQWQENFGKMDDELTKQAMEATLAYLNDLSPPIQDNL